MDSISITNIKRVIAIAAIIYIVCPDFFIGPIDDVIVAFIAGITELGLGIPGIIDNRYFDF